MKFDMSVGPRIKGNGLLALLIAAVIEAGKGGEKPQTDPRPRKG